MTLDRRHRPMLELLLEYCQEKKKDLSLAKYTTRPENVVVDGKEYLSLYKLYLDLGDETEYFFAKEYVGTWKDWIKLSNSKYLRVLVEEWREELQVKLKAVALTNVQKKASEGDVSASKWLLERHWETKGKKIKAEEKKVIEQEARNNHTERVKTDFMRLLDKASNEAPSKTN